MEGFCKDLKEHILKIINYEEKEMIPLTYEEMSFINNKKFFIYAKNNLILIKMTKMPLNYTIK